MAPPAENLTPRQIWTIVGGLATAMLLAFLDQSVFSTALPTIVGELHGVEHMMWVITSYMLASTVMLPIYGKLSDQFGVKWLLAGAIGLFVLGSIIGGLSFSMTQLIIGRAVQGIGGGGLMVLSQTIISQIVDPRERGRYMGPLTGVFGVSMITGPLLGGYFTETIGWRWAFWMNIPLSAVAVLLVIILLPKAKALASRPKFDVTGMVLLTIISTTMVLATTWGGSIYPWGSPVIVSMLAVSGVSVVALIFAERRASEPIMPGVLFRDRNFVIMTIAALAAGMVMIGVMAYMPTYLQMVTGYSPMKSGYLMIPMMVGMVVVSFTVGRMTHCWGRYKWMPLAGVLFMIGGVSLLSAMNTTMPVWIIQAFLTILGIGLGLSLPVFSIVISNQFREQLGAALSTNNYFRQIGASFGVSVVGGLFVSNLTRLLSERMPGMPSSGVGGSHSFTPDIVQHLSPAIRGVIISSYNDALAPVFLLFLPFLVVAFVALLFLYEKPLRTSLNGGYEDYRQAG